MAANAIRKTQVPAYCPVLPGTHEFENNGVSVDVKNTIAIEFMFIIVMPLAEVDMSIELAIIAPDIVEVAAPMPPTVEVGIDIMLSMVTERLFYL